MRCCPRKGRHQWVFFLILVCLVGVYLAYKRLLESEGNARNGHNKHLDESEALPEKIQKLVHSDLKLPKAPIEHLKKAAVIPADIKPELPNVFPAGRVLENEEDYITYDERMTRLKLLLLSLSTSNWKTALDADEMILLVKSEFMDMDIESKMSCKEIDSMKSSSGRYRGFYGKKIIDYVRRDYMTDYVVKSVGRETELKIECMKLDYKEERCHLMGNYKLVKELVLFQILNDPTVITLEGFCVRGETIDPRIQKKGVVLVTEAGKPLQIDSLRMLPWATKVEVGIQLLKLLLHLERSSVGSLRFQKLTMDDFVLLKSDIKLVDLDNLVIGEPTCYTDEDCKVPDTNSKNFKCVEKVCSGLNMRLNLNLLNQVILTPLFEYVPQADTESVNQLKEGIKQLRLNVKDVLRWFQKRSATGGPLEPESEEAVADLPKSKSKTEAPKVKTPYPTPVKTPKPTTKKPDIDVNQIIEKDKEQPKFHPEADNVGDYSYDRFNNANFPGRYDYHCDNSRVSWGCVLTVKSLPEAMAACNKDTLCTSFVLFSSNPEKDDIMTAIMKSADGDEKPDMNHGAVMFRKNRRKPHNKLKPDKSVQQMEMGDKPDVPVVQKADVEVSTKSCLNKVGNITQSARSRREKRLFTHLGLKGISDDQWRTYAQSLSIIRYVGLSSLAPSNVDGGKFKFEFAKNPIDLKRGEFIAELGPNNFHIAHLITYHLDRLLGLYHVPPTVARTLSEAELNSLHGEKFPMSKFKNISTPNGLRGIVTVPMPPVMKTEKINIENRDKLVLTVPEFSRNQKVQIEYILLWTLTKMTQPPHGFLGYKGHLIHFEADLAFQSLSKTLTGYFYNCQFPNTVYKTLVCYKCQDTNKMTTVCGLGAEVLSRLKRNGVADSDLKIGSLSGTDLMNVIDNSASAILMVVEQCIKTFSREMVLY